MRSLRKPTQREFRSVIVREEGKEGTMKRGLNLYIRMKDFIQDMF